MQITRRTIISTVINLLAFVNAVMVMLGKPVLNIDSGDLTVTVNAVITAVVWIYGFWKNNSFTPEAIKADEYLDLLRHDEWVGERAEEEPLYYEDDEEPEEEDEGIEELY